MPGAARVGTDTAGGTQLGGGQGTVYVEGVLWVVKGDAVASHPPCPVPASHCAATMETMRSSESRTSILPLSILARSKISLIISNSRRPDC